MNKLKLAWFTPCKKGKDSLSSVFSDQILPELRKKVDVTIFTDNFQDYSDESGSYPTFHYLRAAEQQQDFDLFVYQVENNPDCGFMRFHLGQIPGMVIFHHLNFLSLGPDPLLNSPYNKIQEMMEQGVWPARDAKFPRKPPQPKREAAFCLLPVFTNPQYVTDFNNQNFTSIARDYNLPASYLPFPMSVATTSAKTKNNQLTLATPAKIGTSERIVKILKTVARLPQIKLNWLIDQAERAQAEDLIREFEVAEQVEIHTDRTVDKWEELACNSDIALHLQYSAYDQPAPYLMQSLLSETVVICNRNSYSEFLNDNLVFKLSSGVSEQAELLELLKSWGSFNTAGITRESQEFAKDHYDPKLIAEELCQLIKVRQPQIDKFYADWQGFQAKARKQLFLEMKDLYQENLDLPELKASWDYFASNSLADITGGTLMTKPKYRLAFVVPRFSEEVIGGAETLVAHLARYLQAEGHQIQILTTCAKDNRTWENHYPAGEAQEFSLPVLRFPVDDRDLETWVPLQVKISQGIKLDLADQLTWMQESVNSRELYSYIVNNQDNFDHFIFAPYLFGTTFWGSMLLPEKSLLLPCLHDEVYAYLDLTASMFRQSAGCIFNAAAEQELAETLYGPISGGEVGMGFDLVSTVNSDRVKPYIEDYDIPKDYLLYLGRKETGKNLHLLIDYFLEFKASHPEVKLVIAGGGSMDDINDHCALKDQIGESVVDLGRVSEEEKQSLLKYCLALVQPSTNESFSIVLMEAWQYGRPVIVHADCAVTKQHVVESNAGFYFTSPKELAGIIKFCLNEPELINEIGKQGYDYVKTKYSWEAVVGRFHKVYQSICAN